MLLSEESSFMSQFEDACCAWVDSVGSSPSLCDSTDSEVGLGLLDRQGMYSYLVLTAHAYVTAAECLMH